MSDRAELELLLICAACDIDGFERAKQFVNSDMFSVDDLRTAWSVIEAIHKSGSDRVDYAQLMDGMSDAGIRPIGQWVERIVSASYEASHSEYHARRLLSAHRADRLRSVAAKVSDLKMVTEDRLRWLMQEIEELAGGIENDCVSVGEVLAMPVTERRIVKTGFPILDQRIGGGLKAKELMVVGGRPGAGKTTLMMQIAAQSAYLHGTRCLVVTIEMSKEELTGRWHKKITADKLQTLPIYIRDDLSDWMQMQSVIRQTIKRRSIDLVIVDYIQRITHSGTDHRERQIAEISGGLKDIARDANIPVIAGSQLNRESVRKGTRPTLTDLRESGAIEQDSDVVLLLGYNEEQDNMRTFDIAKQRNGPTGKAELRLDGPVFWFHEVEPEHPYAGVDAAWS